MYFLLLAEQIFKRTTYVSFFVKEHHKLTSRHKLLLNGHQRAAVSTQEGNACFTCKLCLQFSGLRISNFKFYVKSISYCKFADRFLAYTHRGKYILE